jgi:hypothetical protein
MKHPKVNIIDNTLLYAIKKEIRNCEQLIAEKAIADSHDITKSSFGFDKIAP